MPSRDPFGLILAAKDWATILPLCTTKVSIANSYELSAVPADRKIEIEAGKELAAVDVQRLSNKDLLTCRSRRRLVAR